MNFENVEYRENPNNWAVSYSLKLWEGVKKILSENVTAFHLSRPKKRQKFLDLTKRGKPNGAAHRPIIQVFTPAQKPGWNVGILKSWQLRWASQETFINRPLLLSFCRVSRKGR